MTVVSRYTCVYIYIYIYISQYILLKFLSSILYWFVYDDNESCTSSIHSTWKFDEDGLKLTSNNGNTVHCELHVMCFNSLMSTVLLMIEGGFFFWWGVRGLQLGGGRVNNCVSLQFSFRLWRLICFGSNLNEGNDCPEWERDFKIFVTVSFEYSMFILFDIVRD